MQSLHGPLRLTHVAGQVRGAGTRAFMAPNYDVTWAGAPCVRCCVQLTHGIARWSRYEGVKQHRGTAPPGLPSTLCRCSELVADVTPFRRNRSPKINQQIPSTCAPSNFVRSVLPFVTTTRGSSECRPDDKAEATSRFVVLCDAKQGPQGFVAEPQKPVTNRAHSDGYQI